MYDSVRLYEQDMVDRYIGWLVTHRRLIKCGMYVQACLGYGGTHSTTVPLRPLRCYQNQTTTCTIGGQPDDISSFTVLSYSCPKLRIVSCTYSGLKKKKACTYTGQGRIDSYTCNQWGAYAPQPSSWPEGLGQCFQQARPRPVWA